MKRLGRASASARATASGTEKGVGEGAVEFLLEPAGVGRRSLMLGGIHNNILPGVL